MPATPTYDEVVNAVMAELRAASLTGVFLHFENRRMSEAELLREYRSAAPDFESEITLIECDVDDIEGKAHGENYSIYKVEVRHLYTRQDEEEISRIAKFRAERIRNAITGNTDIFRIGSQVPLRTAETASLSGRFVDRDDSRYYESVIRFEVEGRRWL